jgi:hypothetical protein
MITPARLSRQPVPELLDLVRALARADAKRDYARSHQERAARPCGP